MDAFNERWYSLLEVSGDDVDEREPFDSLLEEVDLLADAFADYDHEGGPGMSSAYSLYYVESQSKAQDALMKFSGGIR